MTQNPQPGQGEVTPPVFGDTEWLQLRQIAAANPPPAPPERPSRVPWIVAAVIVVVALVGGGAFWVLSSRASAARSAEMESALSDLRASISVAEDSLSRAKEAADSLTTEAEAAGDVESQQLAAEADAAIVQFATALDGAREALATAETQKRPSRQDVQIVQETQVELTDLTVQLDETTHSVEVVVGELHLLKKAGNEVDESGAPSATKPATCVAPVAGAYPCAGGPIPGDAKPLTVRYDDVRGKDAAKLVTPSENIVCSMVTDETVCMVLSWDPSISPTYSELFDGQAAVSLKRGQKTVLGNQMEAPVGSYAQGRDEVPYGTVWYFGDFVFASEENGLTFWDSQSGYGALINRDGYYPFGPH